MDERVPPVAQVIDALKTRLGDRLSVNAAVREQHGRGESWHPSAPPDAVAFPLTTAEVAEIVKVCAAHKVPMVPFGAGTSLEGQVNAVRGGLSIDLSRMTRIVAVNQADLDCMVEAGVTRAQLNAHLRDLGLFFPVDPGAECTLGGMVATRASGTNAVRYGTMRELVLGLTVVLADGSIIRTGGRARKSAAGYDLTRLMIGSEGTLGIVTEITLRLSAVPEAVTAATVSFPSVDAAVESVIAVIQTGIPIARIELLDEVSVAAVNRYSKLSLDLRPTLFLEFHGTQASVAENTTAVEEIAAEHGGSGFQWADQAEDRSKLWEARHKAYYAGLALRPDAKGLVTDVCVPISRLAQCIAETKQDLAKASMPAPLLGHVGDGNFHVCFIIDPAKPGELHEAEHLHDRMVARAQSMGGTCTGEHGIGLGKTEHLKREAGAGVAVMKAIKQALDPLGLMNPGKMF
ncbi:MAG: FAD-linked oxidase C-terminal domain-containing protein [Rhodospirillaceae bacterium]|nr:FAD-linked oxidase C-terminal domain-containing protein [Rhodospirillaceae bacterium]